MECGLAVREARHEHDWRKHLVVSAGQVQHKGMNVRLPVLVESDVCRLPIGQVHLEAAGQNRKAIPVGKLEASCCEGAVKEAAVQVDSRVGNDVVHLTVKRVQVEGVAVEALEARAAGNQRCSAELVQRIREARNIGSDVGGENVLSSEEGRLPQPDAVRLNRKHAVSGSADTNAGVNVVSISIVVVIGFEGEAHNCAILSEHERDRADGVQRASTQVNCLTELQNPRPSHLHEIV
mmetsp:Transcript_732/g.2623  ORF Transcript_732/g.2623 Transcript_732/m.2623 type:complete len:236 (+) Transcript_732:450-1157(+)